MKTLFFLFLFTGGIFYGQYFTNEFYQELLDKEYTKVLTGQNTNFGNYAGVGIKDDIATIAANLKIKKNSSLNINIKGGATEGLVALLEGEKVSSNIAISAQFNFGLYNRNIGNKKKEIILDATKEINFISYVDNLQIESEKAIADLNLLKQKTELELLQKKEKCEILNKKHNENILKDFLRKEIVQDSIALQINILNNEIEDLNRKIIALSAEKIAAKIKSLHEKNYNAIKDEKDKLTLPAFRLDWISVFGNLRNRSFKHFINENLFDNQISKINYNRIEVGFAYNIYEIKDEKRNSYFLSIGLSYSLDDNFEDLIKKTLNDKQDISGPPNNRSLSETATVYNGEYKKNISNVIVSPNLYWFPTKSREIAFHIQPALKYNLTDKVKFDNTVGCMFGFTDSNKDKNILNIELFYNMKDIFKKSENTDDQLTDRSILGINFNFPITFKQHGND